MGILYAKALEWFGKNATPEQRKEASQLTQAKKLSYVFNCFLQENSCLKAVDKCL